MAEQANNNEQAELHFNTAVYDAAKHGNLDDLVTALASDPNLIDTPNPFFEGQTPLSVAAMNGHVSVIEVLVELGSKAIDTADESGETPMTVAAFHGRTNAIETLVRLGSRAMDTPNWLGWTPLHAAAYCGHASVIETLVHLGSNAIDTLEDDHKTPMNCAARNGQIEAVKTLVRLGSKAIGTPDISGRTPIQTAAAFKHWDCAEALQCLADFQSTASPLPESEVLEITSLKESSSYKVLKALKRVQQYLHAGFTSVRIAGDADVGFGVIDLQRALREGLFDGPSIYGAAHYLSIQGGGGDLCLGWEQHGCYHPDGKIVCGPEEMRRVVRDEIKYGSGWIKLLVSGAFMTGKDDPNDCHFSREEVFMATSEARRLSDTPVMCHAHSVESIRLSLEAGALSIEHGSFLAREPQALIPLFLQQSAFLVPTLYIGEYYANERPSSTSSDMDKMIELSRSSMQLHLEGVALAHAAGIPICFGSDDVGAWPAQQSMRELLLLAKAGLSPKDCIAAATTNNARLLQNGAIGGVEAGMDADLIAVHGNPLEDLAVFEKALFFVMKHGKTVRHDRVERDRS